MGNVLQRFLLEDLDIRGAIVSLDSVWQDMLADRNYPEPAVQLLGEICATTLLLGQNLKQTGRLTIQLSGNGPISMLIMDCNERLDIRGMVKCSQNIKPGPVPDLLGDGQLLLSLDMPSMREAYQSIVPLEGHNIAEIFEYYLKQSEQLSSRIFLTTSADAIIGILLQKLPTTDQRDNDGWARAETLAATVNDSTLFNLPTEAVLKQLFSQETLRIFDPQTIHYGCQKDWHKIHSMLRSLGRQEVDAILKEQGEIVITDDICNHKYRFDALAVDTVFREDNSTIH